MQGDQAKEGACVIEPFSISFRVHAVPKAQPRQRHRIVFGKGKAFASNYTPRNDPVQDYKASVRAALQLVYDGPPIDKPLKLTLTFLMPRPKSMIWKTRPMPRAWCMTKPDLDNLEKSLKDALNKLLWVDDSCVCVKESSKLYASGDEAPGVHVQVRELHTDQHRTERMGKEDA